MSQDAAPTRIENEFRGIGARFPVSLAKIIELTRQSDIQHIPDNDAQIAVDMGQNFHNCVAAYKKACLEATDELSGQPTILQQELNQIWLRHRNAMIELEKFYVRHAILTNALPAETVSRICKELDEQASIIADMAIADKLLDKLNLPYRRQMATRTSPENVALAEAYWISRVQDAAEFLEIVNNIPHFQTVAQVAYDYRAWSGLEEVLETRHAELGATVGSQLLLDFCIVNGHDKFLLPAEEEAKLRISLQYSEALDREEGEGEGWRGPREMEPIDVDDEIDVNWTSRDFADLREQLALPIRITVNVGRLASLKQLDFRQTQHLDNQCSICTQEVTEPTELARCHHMFCFECIVPWVSGYEKCPKCRKPAELHDLTIYRITRLEAVKGKAGQKSRSTATTSEVGPRNSEDTNGRQNLEKTALNSQPKTSTSFTAMPYFQSPRGGWPAAPQPAARPSRMNAAELVEQGDQ